jgi:NAD+ diphosphatase
MAMPHRRLLQNLALSRNVIVHDERATSSQAKKTLTLPVWAGNLPVEVTESKVNLKFLSSSTSDNGIEVFVGEFNGVHYSINLLENAIEDVSTWKSLREIGFELDDLEVGIATTATALSQWHEKNKFCSQCGSRNEVSGNGWSRICPNQHQVFPRSDPAIICLVTDLDDRALLARRIDWEAGWMSTLAGFVEAGESAEAALAREIKEEAGIEIDLDSIEYLGSQPWPFPHSLMLGYRAIAKDIEISVDMDEIVEAAWFSREEFTQACNAGTLKLPPPVSIASRLIQDWYQAQLQPEWFRK